MSGKLYSGVYKIRYKIFIGLLIFQLNIIQILFKSKNNLILENIELRQQLAIYNHKKDKTKIITDLTRLFLVALKESWGKWKYALLVVKPETVIHWQKRRFKKYWTQKTNIHRKPPGRPKISLELRLLIKQMVIDNYNWGAQKIFSEILKLGYTETQLSPREKSILTFIGNNAGCKSGEIAKKLGIPSPTVKRILPELLEKNLITKHGVGPGTNYSLK